MRNGVQGINKREMKRDKRPFEELAKEINDQFNWEKLRKAMIATDWNWKMGETSMGIPDIKTLKNTAYELLEYAYDTGNTHSTGGFFAGWQDDKLYLVFTLLEAESL